MSKITEEYVCSRIAKIDYRYCDLITFCIITLDNQFKLTGEALCADKSWYDQEVGEKLAFKEAIDKGIGYFTFNCKEDYYKNA